MPHLPKKAAPQHCMRTLQCEVQLQFVHRDQRQIAAVWLQIISRTRTF
jgi:hypothetical protein